MMRRMLRVHVECMRQRARNEARPTLLLARSWVSSGKLQSMLLRQQSASPRLCVCFLFGRRSLHLRECRCLIHMCARRVEAGTCKRHVQVIGPEVRRSVASKARLASVRFDCIVVWRRALHQFSLAVPCVLVLESRFRLWLRLH